MSACLSSRKSRVRSPHASPLAFESHASLAQSADALVSNARCSPFESEAMHQRITCPRGATGRHSELKPRFMHVQIVPGTPTQYTTVSPSWWNGIHTCLRNRRASIPSSNLGEGTTDHSRLAQRESGCLESVRRLPPTTAGRQFNPVTDYQFPRDGREDQGSCLQSSPIAGSNPARASSLSVFCPRSSAGRALAL